MPSSPEAVAVAWLPPDFATHTSVQRVQLPTTTARLFELCSAAGVPDEVVAPARTAAVNAGYVTGWNAGHQAGIARAAEDAAQARADLDAANEQTLGELRAATQALHNAAQSLREREAAALGEVENRIVSGAFAVAESLVGVVLRDDLRRGATVVARALAETSDDTPATVVVAPADAAVVRELVASRPGIDVTVDADLSPGDAYARFGASTVDARISTGLDRVRALLDGGAAA